MELNLATPETDAFKGYLFQCGPCVVKLVPCGAEYRVIETIGPDLCTSYDKVFTNIYEAHQAWMQLVTEVSNNELTYSAKAQEA